MNRDGTSQPEGTHQTSAGGLKKYCSHLSTFSFFLLFKLKVRTVAFVCLRAAC